MLSGTISEIQLSWSQVWRGHRDLQFLSLGKGTMLDLCTWLTCIITTVINPAHSISMGQEVVVPLRPELYVPSWLSSGIGLYRIHSHVEHYCER